MEANAPSGGMSRRTFFKGAGAATATMAASGVLVDALFEKAEPAFAAEANQQSAEEKVVQSHCSCNCASRCPLCMHVKDDEIQWIQSETEPACAGAPCVAGSTTPTASSTP